MSHCGENAFLPAALEIQETPPSPAGRITIWTIVLFFVLAILWATIGEIDIVAVAQGRIIPNGHSKVVQPLEIGTVKAIHVKEGQHVNAGDVLIELDSDSARADVDRLAAEVASVEREIDRLRKLAEWVSGEKPTTGKTEADDETPSLLSEQWREFQDRLSVLAREEDRQLAEKRSAEQQVNKLKAILPLLNRRAKDQKRLSDKKLLAEQQYLETEQERLTTLHDLRTHESRVEELVAATAELRARSRFVRSEFHRQTLEKLEESDRKLSYAQLELIKAQARFRAQTVLAPVSGTVQQLAIRNVGAVVTPAQEVMVIVPEGAQLEVEASLDNKDVGFVQVGQQVAIKIDTFPFTKYGVIDGRVIDISNDAMADENKGLVYKLRVAMSGSSIPVNGEQATLSPGMTVTVESKTGTRKMIEYFLSPLLRYKDESVRER